MSIRTILVVIIAGILVFILYSSIYGAKVGVGDPVPNFKVYDLDGNEVASGDIIRGPALIHFWGWWCRLCVREADNLIGLGEVMGGRLSIIAIHEGMSPGDFAAVKKIMYDKKINYSIYMDGGDAGDLFGVRMVPVSFLVDGNGIVRGRKYGAHNWLEPKTLKSIEDLQSRYDH
jgi:thiol-disulfide isomerase/thioredoxin